MKKSIGFGKKNLYLGFAFLVVVGLLSLFVFSGAREGFYTTVDGANVLDSSKIATISAANPATATTNPATATTNLANTSSISAVSAVSANAQKCSGDSSSVNATTGERIQCSNFTSQTSCVKPCTWK
jgi:cytoskeletal protein RodZ